MLWQPFRCSEQFVLAYVPRLRVTSSAFRNANPVQTSAGFIYVTQGYISMSYSEERERGKFVAIALNLQALGAVVGGIIPLIINRNKVSPPGFKRGKCLP